MRSVGSTVGRHPTRDERLSLTRLTALPEASVSSAVASPLLAGRLMPIFNRRSFRMPLLVLAVAIATSGCGILYKQPIYQGNLIEKTAVDQLQKGMSQQDVMGLLGTPSISDPYNENRWDYTATQRIDRRGTTEVKNFTVYFENGAVAKWEGEYFAEQDDTLAANARRQFGPNLAKDDKKKKKRR
jgi:outer membrane protein assembly factor BamE